MGTESSMAEVAGNTATDSAEKRLNELGYKQELRREMVNFLFFFSFSFVILILLEQWS